jgi:hypothetical protein
MERAPDGHSLYIGGDFTSFAGIAVNRLVKVDLRTRRVDRNFRFPEAATRVSDLQVVAGRLWVAGTFARGIVSVDPVSGARTSYLNPVGAAGAQTGYPTRVYRFAVNPAGTRAVLIGSFTTVGGKARQQVAMIRLGKGTTSVSAWYSARWNHLCSAGLRWYTRDVDWTPDGTGFVVGTTGSGYPGTAKLCDTVTRWKPTEAPSQQPQWVQYSGGDTFHSVLVTNRAVFVSGHFRWLNNPLGNDSKGPGAVDRRGLASLDPLTGKAQSWNPGKSIEGGMGGFDLYLTRAGLWVGHFENYLGRNNAGTGSELHQGVGLLPY